MGCVVCKNSQKKILHENVPDFYFPEIPGKFQIKKCEMCGLMYIDPQPLAEELALHYPETYPVYQRKFYLPSPVRSFITKLVAENYLGYGRPRWWRIFLIPFYVKFSHLPKRKENGNILDVGCETGTRFPLFRSLGWKVKGVEMNKGAAEAAQKAGYDVLCASFEGVEMPRNSFDAVYVNNVFEHFANPHGVLEKTKETLVPEGELILVVPNGEGLAARLFGRHWFGLEVPRHLFTYNKKSIGKLMLQHGFEVQNIIYPLTFGSFSSSLAYLLGKRANFFSFLEWPIWLLNFLVDPIFCFWGIGDWMIIRAKIKK